MKKFKNSPYLRQVFLRLILFRLFLPLLAVGLLANVGIGYLGEQNLVKQQNQVIQSVAHIIDYHLDHGGRILDAVARVAETSDGKNLSTFMESTWKAYGYFETIYCLDEYNKIKLITPADPRYIGLDMSNLPDFKKNENKKKLTISRPFISLRTGEPTVYLVRPLSNGGCIIGELNLGLFQQEITNITSRSSKDFVFIMDQTGTLLAHPFPDLVKQQINLSNLKIFGNILAGKDNAFYMDNGRRVIGSAARVEKTGWIVVDQVPLSVFLNSYAWTVGLSLLVSLIIWITLLWNLRKQLQRHVITPLEHLNRETNALTAGDFNKSNSFYSSPTAFAELNKLAEDFQCMSTNLQVRETALLESEERYRGLFDRVPIGLFRTTLTGQILDINPTVMFMLGYPDREELLKVNITNLLYTASFSMDNRQEQSMIEDIWNQSSFETQLRCYDRTIIWVQINSNIVYDPKNEVQYLEGSMQDITERKHTENKIKEQQELLLKSEKEQREALEKALIMKDEFISLISHEFKTPLNVIYSALQLIESVYFNQISDRVKELVGNIKQNTFRQLRLANNLLDVTRLNSGQFKLNEKNIDIVFLTKVITQSVELYANQKNITISFNSHIESKIISIDDEKYERIILNILSNAMKFTKNGGIINVTLNENRKSNLVKVRITDTGIGIPKDKQKLIFERFGQVDSNLSRQAEGTGIGLSLVKLLVNILGGTIDVESELDVGSTFIIVLPAKKEIVHNEFQSCLDVENRLVSEIKVEFSDIYL